MEKLLIYILPSLSIFISALLVIWANRNKKPIIQNIIYRNNIDIKDPTQLKEGNEFMFTNATMITYIVLEVTKKGIICKQKGDDQKIMSIAHYLEFDRLKIDYYFRILV